MRCIITRLSLEQFEIIRHDLENAYDLYDVFCAVLYMLRGVVENVTFRVGNWFTITSGQSLIKTAKAFAGNILN